jgi:hypothetical protein
MNPIDRRLESLSRESMADILRAVVDLCYLDEDEQGDLVFNPERDMRPAAVPRRPSPTRRAWPCRSNDAGGLLFRVMSFLPRTCCVSAA